jgi:hypothetical protein
MQLEILASPPTQSPKLECSDATRPIATLKKKESSSRFQQESWLFYVTPFRLMQPERFELPRRYAMPHMPNQPAG